MGLNISEIRDSDDSQYLKSIEKYKNESWYDRLLENPWLGSKQAAFAPNLWQSIGEVFGDYQAQTDYYQGLASNRNQWLSDTLAQYHQQDYDSATEQAARLQAAGINPALSGNVTAGASAENDQPIGASPLMSANNGGLVDIVNVGSQIISTCFSFVSAFQGVKSIHLDNAIKSLSVNDKLHDIAWQNIGEAVNDGITGLEDFTIGEMLSDNSMMVKRTADLMPDVLEDLSKRIDKFPYSRSEKRKLKNMIPSLVRSSSGVATADFEKLVSDKLASLKEARHRNFKAAGMPGADVVDPHAAEFLSENIYLRINPLLLDIQELELNNKKSYLDKASAIGLPANQAISENEGYKLRSEVNKVRTRITNTFREIERKAFHDSSLSPSWKLAIMGALSSGELLLFSKLGGF